MPDLGDGEAESVALVVVVEPGGEPGPEEVDGVVLVAELLADGAGQLVAALVQAQDHLRQRERKRKPPFLFPIGLVDSKRGRK